MLAEATKVHTVKDQLLLVGARIYALRAAVEKDKAALAEAEAEYEAIIRSVTAPPSDKGNSTPYKSSRVDAHGRPERIQDKVLVFLAERPTALLDEIATAIGATPKQTLFALNGLRARKSAVEKVGFKEWRATKSGAEMSSVIVKPKRRRRLRRGAKRKPAQIAALKARLVEYVKKHGGERIEQIGRALELETKELILPVKQLRAERVIAMKGTRRGAVYELRKAS